MTVLMIYVKLSKVITVYETPRPGPQLRRRLPLHKHDTLPISLHIVVKLWTRLSLAKASVTSDPPGEYFRCLIRRMTTGRK